ncbi:PepSY domain-containing protein [Planobispora longispora]|nr:PepSY domain-containing protein [Planobispora longispora]
MTKTHMISKIALAAAGTVALLSAGSGVALAGSGSHPAAASAPIAAAVPAAASAPATGISCAKAVKIAKKRVPRARVTEVEREWEHGHRVCKVELVRGNWEYDVYVSLRTGKIIKFKKKYDD